MKANNLSYFFFCIALLTVPINFSIYQIVRISDIFIILSFIFFLKCKPSINKEFFTIFSIFFAILLLSSFISIINNHSFEITGIAFYYKYSLIFLIPLIVSNVVNSEKRLKTTSKLIYFVFCFLILWVYIYFFLRVNKLLPGAAYRVSYPFSEYWISDAHVYASYLSFTFVAYLEFIRKILRHGIFQVYIIFVLSIGALFLTGSKSGILILFLYFFMASIRFFIHIKLKTIIIFSLALFTVPTLAFMTSDYWMDKEDIKHLYIRTTTYDFEDASIRRRYENLFKSLDESLQNFLIFGKGPTFTSQKWYDGGVSIIIAQGGIFGILAITIYIYLIRRKVKITSKKNNSMYLSKIFHLLLLTYLILSIITEHFLITRNVLPVITLLSLIYVNVLINFDNSVYSKDKIISKK